MSLTNKIKALMILQNKKSSDLAQHLHLTVPAINSKFYRGSFSLADAIKIADCLDCELAFITKDGQKMVLTPDDIPDGKPNPVKDALPPSAN